MYVRRIMRTKPIVLVHIDIATEHVPRGWIPFPVCTVPLEQRNARSYVHFAANPPFSTAEKSREWDCLVCVVWSATQVDLQSMPFLERPMRNSSFPLRFHPLSTGLASFAAFPSPSASMSCLHDGRCLRCVAWVAFPIGRFRVHPVRLGLHPKDRNLVGGWKGNLDPQEGRRGT